MPRDLIIVAFASRAFEVAYLRWRVEFDLFMLGDKHHGNFISSTPYNVATSVAGRAVKEKKNPVGCALARINYDERSGTSNVLNVASK